MIKSIVEESSLDSPYKSINLKRIEPHFANEISERLLLLHHEFDLPKGLIRITDRKSKRNLAYQATNVVSRMRKGKQYGLFDSNLNFSHNMFQTRGEVDYYSSPSLRVAKLTPNCRSIRINDNRP